eukprot:83259-Chlamydomonas_euryale.AAC.1
MRACSTANASPFAVWARWFSESPARTCSSSRRMRSPSARRLYASVAEDDGALWIGAAAACERRA